MREKASVEIIYEQNADTRAKAETLGPIYTFKVRNHYTPDPELALLPPTRFHHPATKLLNEATDSHPQQRALVLGLSGSEPPI